MAAHNTYTFTAKVWLWTGGQGAWHFVSVPRDISARLREQYKTAHHGWNSLRVAVRLGKTEWHTSIFYSNPSHAYWLPLKGVVRKREGILADDEVRVTVEIL